VANVDYMSIYASDLVQAVRKSAGDKGAFMCYILKLIFDLLDLHCWIFCLTLALTH